MRNRVFHIITHFDIGGAERIAINISKSSSAKWEYHIVEVVRGTSDYSSAMIDELRTYNIKFHRSPIRNNKLGIILFPIWFLGIYLKFRPQIIHTHTEVPDLAIYLFHIVQKFTLQKIKYIRTIHNIKLWTDWGKIGSIVEKFFMRHHANIAISRAVQESYKTHYNESPTIVFNGIEMTSQRKFEGLVEDKINILFAGRLEYQKGVDELVAVVSHFANDPMLVFHIVGNGSQKFKVEQLSNFSNVFYYDTIYNLSQYLFSFDYVFMPSNFEGLATLSIESSFGKTPVIINSCGGLEETLPADWPLKVKNNSVQSYISIFNNLPSQDIYRKLADIGYEYAYKNFTIKKMQQNYEYIYTQKIQEMTVL